VKYCYYNARNPKSFSGQQKAYVDVNVMNNREITPGQQEKAE
jgi:hypothetical protein